MEKKIKELEEISALFEAEQIKLSLVDFAIQTFALVDGAILGGGLLMSTYANPRLTMDLDLVVVSPNNIKDILLQNGYVTKDHLQYSKPDREIIKLWKDEREVDLIFFKDKKIEKFLTSTAVKKYLFGKDIKILSLEGFLLTKIIAWRTRDRADIESILAHKQRFDINVLKDLASYLKMFDRMAIFDG